MNTTDCYRVTAKSPHHGFLFTFLIEAVSGDDAEMGVKLALSRGIMPPHGTNQGWFAPVIRYDGVPSLRQILKWEFSTTKLDGYPHILVFPDPNDRDAWVRYQLSWYGRLWADIKSRWRTWILEPWRGR